MKYTVQVTGEAALGLPEQDFELEAPDGNAAVDATRAHLLELLPKEGGLLEVSVSCVEEWVKVSQTSKGGTLTETVPAGEVSSFSFRVEPHADVRAAVEAAAKAAEDAAAKAAERATIELEFLAKLQQQGLVAKDVKVATEEEPVGGKAVSK
jgi:hypothetical protein